MSLFSIFSTKQDIDTLDTRHRVLAEDLNKIKARSATLPKKISLYSDIMAITQLFYKKQFDPLFFATDLMPVFQNMGLAKTFHWNLTGIENVTKTSDKRELRAQIELNLTFPHESRNQLVDGVHQLMARLKAAFPAYAITFSDIPGITSDNADMRTVIGDENVQEKASASLNDFLKIDIVGPVEKSK